MIQRIMIFTYGVACYLSFLAVAAYAAGWIGNFGTVTRLDGEPRMAFWAALATDAGLLFLFALQHSIMARRWFKAWWTKLVPEAAERSTYVLATNLALGVMFIFWQPLGGDVWKVESSLGQALIYSLYAMGWGIVLASTFLINHFDLFGLRQVWLQLKGRGYEPLPFDTPMFYRYVRHPLYVGWLYVFWSTPHMTVAHLVFALMATGYILTAIRFEEADLVAHHGERYRRYQETVPMLIPAVSDREAATMRTSRRAAG